MKELDIIDVIKNHSENFDKIYGSVVQEQKETLEIINSIQTKNKKILNKAKKIKDKINKIQIDKVLKNNLLFGFSHLTYIWNEETNNIELVKIKELKTKEITIVAFKNIIQINKIKELENLWKELKNYNVSRINIFCNSQKTFVFIKTKLYYLDDVINIVINNEWQIDNMTFFYKNKDEIFNTIIKTKNFVYL